MVHGGQGAGGLERSAVLVVKDIKESFEWRFSGDTCTSEDVQDRIQTKVKGGAVFFSMTAK